ncbi:MAG: biopolymer transporter ExbD [Chitinophagaceae bacterium]|nr:MAG: biopolymer transporter ExbD [Chitinophagaceae bacterium]
MARSKIKPSQEINAGSMADIAFLLLIFFLVTTTIESDRGILHRLPPWSDEPPPVVDINQRNTLVILINANDQLLVRDEPLSINQLRQTSKEFIDNRGRDPRKSDSPDDAVISLQNDRGTSYNMYIQVQNELKAAYTELRNEYSQRMYGRLYDDLPEDLRSVVRSEYPMRISEAEPKDVSN